MRTLGGLFTIMIGFIAGIAFVYSCGGGGSSSSADVAALEARVNDLEAKLAYLMVDDTSTINGLAPPHVIFRGANLHVQNGLAHTNSINGLGNLIVGYNEPYSGGTPNRSGSHNLVVGSEHTYTSYGGFVAGILNTILAPNSSVSGGLANLANGIYSSVSGGSHNEASDPFTSVCGGYKNSATGDMATVSGGQENTASGYVASVSGGYQRTASGDFDWAAGTLLENQ